MALNIDSPNYRLELLNALTLANNLITVFDSLKTQSAVDASDAGASYDIGEVDTVPMALTGMYYTTAQKHNVEFTRLKELATSIKNRLEALKP